MESVRFGSLGEGNATTRIQTAVQANAQSG